MLTFMSPTNFRQIILCSTLSERPVLIDKLHISEDPPGIKQWENKFLQLVAQISTHCKYEISSTGCAIKYYPGIITNNNGQQIQFDCGNFRNLTYFLEPVIVLALFGKSSLSLNLLGITNDD